MKPDDKRCPLKLVSYVEQWRKYFSKKKKNNRQLISRLDNINQRGDMSRELNDKKSYEDSVTGGRLFCSVVYNVLVSV